ncbi:uncharacterized protein LOC111047265 isoform X1 [Nilaparvata lugens]|uniref:uncharacterized protein LOC111047265 isoform X1 n=1 Tax=Nilaparvata lugens TaxID=108931 RepID=UPI000B998CC3|nr:uncharacterized protein LOC111047265 isoform X1 [Nilaparvata lugens]
MWTLDQGCFPSSTVLSLLSALTALQFCCVGGVQITALKVPETVVNGSEAAILDCEYTLKPEESKAVLTSGLVIKWFFNNGPAPVYQWIPGQKPQELGLLKGRLDLQHKASSQVAAMYRALRIVRPTTDLSGEYKCTVSTFDNEDFMIKKMIVYAPEKRLEVMQAQAEQDAVNISCRAQGLFPEPKMSLYKITDADQRIPMEGVNAETTRRQEAGEGYDITATARLHDEELNTTAVIECLVLLPGTPYSRKKSMVYYPGRALAWTDSGGMTTWTAEINRLYTIIYFIHYCIVSLLLASS